MEKKKNPIKKVLIFIGIGVAAAGSLYVFTPLRHHVNEAIDSVLGTNINKEELQAPTNISFDEKAGLFTWDSVKNADFYEIEVLDSEGYVAEKNITNTNTYSIDYSELAKNGSTYFEGDKIGISVKGVGDEYLDSDTVTQEFVFENHPEVYNQDVLQNVLREFEYKFEDGTLKSIDYLNFQQGTVSGKIDYQEYSNDYFIIFNSSYKNVKDDDTFKNFYNTIDLYSYMHAERDYIKGKYEENDICKQFMLENIGVDESKVKDIIFFYDQLNHNRRSNFYSMAIITEQDGSIKYELYSLGSRKYIGSQEFLTDKLQQEPETFLVHKYQEYTHSSENSEYLPRLQQDLENYNSQHAQTPTQNQDEQDMTF